MRARAPTGDCTPVNQCVTLRRGTLGTVEDTFLSGDQPNWVAGTESSLWTGKSGGGNENRILLKFDLSSIPPSADVTSAILTAGISWNMVPTGPSIHEVLGPWSEATTSLSNFTAAVDPAPIASFPAGFGYLSANLTNVVSDWVQFPSSNFGVQIRDTLPASHLIWSSEASLTNRPKLDVCYTICQ
ncbi:MAG: DNRLRE domain-containing protein [Polyangiaceae bacterium]|nr:DNRLRE domain-containing protein [Polyangiaceae bacterium]